MLAIRPARDWFPAWSRQLSDKQMEIARRILKEINDRLRFLVDVGLDYLNLSRGSGTLSGGESQRIRLASQIGSGLTGVLYVLDEPSIGLHQRDNTRLLTELQGLRDLGNSVLVVEHDEEAILTADYVIDMGPAAGVHGGQIIAEGKPADIMANPNSITGQYLTGAREIEVPEERRPINKKKMLKVIGATGNNLKGVTGEIPVGTFTCITGVSRAAASRPSRSRPSTRPPPAA
jgi:excinuclease ABC subunit A